jgi:hypothetical protein
MKRILALLLCVATVCLGWPAPANADWRIPPTGGNVSVLLDVTWDHSSTWDPPYCKYATDYPSSSVFVYQRGRQIEWVCIWDDIGYYPKKALVSTNEVTCDMWYFGLDWATHTTQVITPTGRMTITCQFIPTQT